MEENKKQLKQLVFNAPKAELHVHLEGSISLNFWEKHFPDLHQEILFFHYTKRKSLPIFLECMEKIHKSLNTPHLYYLACLDLLDQLIYENIKYVEITWAPGGAYEFHDIEPTEVFGAIQMALNAKKEFIDARILVDIIRNQNISIAKKMIDWISSENPKEVVGINFGGDEEKYKVDKFLCIFSQAKELGLGITIHAGESANEKEFIKSVRQVKPNRIGHATSLVSKHLIDQIVSTNYHIEACPTSNYILGYLSNQATHPSLLNLYINSSINTDDRTFFAPSLTEELLELLSNKILSIHDVATMQRNAVNSAFAKQDLRFLSEVNIFWSRFDGCS